MSMMGISRTSKGLAVGSVVATLMASTIIVPNVVSAASGPHYTINIQLPPGTGVLSSSQNKAFITLTKQYEKMHPNITVNWIPIPGNPSITQLNATLIARAAAHAADDVIFEQYGPVNSGALPTGLLQNLKPYLMKKSPYAKGYRNWLSTWQPSTIPYMTNASGAINILLGSTVATEIVYNKADFAKVGIKSTPTTFAQWVQDMAKLKKGGITPLMFGTGGPCNSSWYERKFQSALLHAEISKFNVDHQQILTGLDVAVAIKKGIISMNNPAYAEGWKLLGQLRQYMAPGQSTYDACSVPSQTTPPLPELQPFVQNKFAMAWFGSWDIPDLNQLGFTGKFGFFPFPTITKATTPFSQNVNVTGTVGGPNGTGEWSITSQNADSSMTPAKTKWVVNFLQWLYAPKNEASWVADTGNNAYVPLIKGAKAPKAIPGLDKLVPQKFPPATVDAITNASLTNQAQNNGMRLIQAYLGGSMNYQQFAQQWEAILQQAAQQWAQANKVNLSKY